MARIATKLWAHPANATRALDRWINVRLDRLSPTNLHIIYEARGDISHLVLPPSSPPFRANNLWRTTCFEMFIKNRDRGGYRELNFSPSGQWAAYEFDAYRAGMRQTPMPGDPIFALETKSDRLTLDVRLSLDLSDEPYSVGFAAVIEEEGLGISYWAGTHAGDRPDFHHPATFDLELPPAPQSSPRT